MARGRGRAWTPDEDAAILAAAAETREHGLTVLDRSRPAGEQAIRAARLADVARQLGRTKAAVQKRAERIGAWSYAMHGSGRRRDGAGDMRE